MTTKRAGLREAAAEVVRRAETKPSHRPADADSYEAWLRASIYDLRAALTTPDEPVAGHKFHDEWAFQRSMTRGNAEAGKPISPDQPCFDCGVPFKDHATPDEPVDLECLECGGRIGPRRATPDEPRLDVRRVKQAIVNVAKRHGIEADQLKAVDTYSVATIFGYSKTTPDMDAEIAAEYARLSSKEAG